MRSPGAPERPGDPEGTRAAAGGAAGWFRFCLDQRITVFVLFVTVLVVGAVAALGIPVEMFPRGYTEPALYVRTLWPDAPPEEVQDEITLPLEEELSTVRGVDRMVSVSVTGNSRIFLRFDQGADMDVAYREVRDRVERARRRLPDEVDRIHIGKEDSSGIPVFVLGIAVDPSITQTYDLIQNEIILPIERVDGVASVSADGLEQREVLIELDRDKVEAYGLNVWELGRELGRDNFTLASGDVRDGGRRLLLRSVARYADLQALEQRPVRPGLRLGEVASIRYEEPEKNYRVRAMGRPAFALVVFKEGEANPTEVSDQVETIVERLKTNPRLAGVESIVLFSQGRFIRESLTTLLRSGLVGGLLAALVLFLFLRRYRMTVIVALSIPVSLLVALGVMFFAGETVNVLTMLGLMVCVGLLVDNSVVVAENIHRLRQQGLGAREAAMEGASEVAFAITTSTLTTVAVFLPVALVEGQAQFFFLRMALPITAALLASLLVALVFVPLAVYLSLEGASRPGAGRRVLESAGGVLAEATSRLYRGIFHPLGRVYERWLAFHLKRRLDLVLGLAGMFALTMIFSADRVQFVQVQESERQGFEILVEMPETSTLEETEAWFLEVEKVLESNAASLDLEGWFHFHRRAFGEIQGWFRQPRSTDLTAKQVTERVLELLPPKAGARFFTGDERNFEDEDSESVYTLTLNGEDPEALERAAVGAGEVLASVKGVLGVRRDFERSPNELGLVVERDRAQRLGVHPEVVAGTVGYALRGAALPKFYREGREVPVRIRFNEEDRTGMAKLAGYRVPVGEGAFSTLSALTRPELVHAPSAIVRRDKRMARTVSLELAEEAQAETRKRLDARVASLDLPEGVAVGSMRRPAEDPFANVGFAMSLSVVFIYLLMGFLFESFTLPLSIVLTIPLSFLGVLWVHLATGRDLDFLGAVGVVLLVGVVVNNGIVLVDTIQRLRSGGMDRDRAVRTAAKRRFRPIMMTAITTVGGLVPLALAGRAASGISYTSFSLALIGGMTSATLLTLLVVPVFYTMFDDLRNAWFSVTAPTASGGEGSAYETRA